MSSAKTHVRKDSINHVSNISVHHWNTDQVRIWLSENRLTAFVDIFEKNKVDGKYLLQLTHSILKDEFLISSYDDRIKILSALNRLSKGIFSIDEKAEKYILYQKKHANQQHTLSRRHSTENNNLSIQLSATTPNQPKQDSSQNVDDSIIGMYSNDIYGQNPMIRNFSESSLPVII
ncbi:hypothetical protein PIROE2DRAFT_59697 [Piromyces sp. E2]|nr:hypothetical protein PIROE2DRAFT_59697 [Piromyces sp. E2]|eukprot:OUM65910.1 hypothetical protein PIROE2DRAFT_59697 [Piromyces sp. E2]